jgi:DNA recombination-dependent growth factor C
LTAFSGADRVDAASERYFEDLKSSLKDGLQGFDVPASYDSPSLGLTSSVKNQEQCGEFYPLSRHI